MYPNAYTDVVKDIYEGDSEKIEKILSDSTDIHIYSVNRLMNAKQNEEYRIALVPLVFKGQADHPGQFLKYKKIVDSLIDRFGIGYLIQNAEHPEFFKYDKTSGQMSYIKNANLVSPQMRTYLEHIRVRKEAPRKKTSALLNDIDEETKSANFEVKKAVQIVKRHIASNYRFSSQKSKES